jgi:histone H3/H4
MTITKTNRLFVDKDTGKLMSFKKKKCKKWTYLHFNKVAIQKLVRSKMEISKINKVAKFALNSTIALWHYSPTASNKKTIDTLIKKDMKLQKEKIERLIWKWHKKILNIIKNTKKCLKMKKSKN